MTITSEALASFSDGLKNNKQIFVLADVCFEMFAIKELRRPHLILDELRSAFPDFEEPEILAAIAMALSWRRMLRSAGRALH
jgi:hypothetical protein